MTSKHKKDIIHTDVLGQELKIDDFVAYPSSSGYGRNSLKIGKIVGVTAKMVKVVHLNRRVSAWNKVETKVTTRYPDDCVRLDEKLMTLYILTHSNQE